MNSIEVNTEAEIIIGFCPDSNSGKEFKPDLADPKSPIISMALRSFHLYGAYCLLLMCLSALLGKSKQQVQNP